MRAMFYTYCSCPSDYYSVSATVTVGSEFDVLCGQRNRSGPNFTVPATGNYTISVDPKIVQRFSIWQDNAVLLIVDKDIFQYPDHGSTVRLEGGTDYYIGNPTAQADFRVTLTQQAMPF